VRMRRSIASIRARRTVTWTWAAARPVIATKRATMEVHEVRMRVVSVPVMLEAHANVLTITTVKMGRRRSVVRPIVGGAIRSGSARDET
jgi:hypothetical protein